MRDGSLMQSLCSLLPSNLVIVDWCTNEWHQTRCSLLSSYRPSVGWSTNPTRISNLCFNTWTTQRSMYFRCSTIMRTITRSTYIACYCGLPDPLFFGVRRWKSKVSFEFQSNNRSVYLRLINSTIFYVFLKYVTSINRILHTQPWNGQIKHSNWCWTTRNSSTSPYLSSTLSSR